MQYSNYHLLATMYSDAILTSGPGLSKTLNIMNMSNF